MSDNQSHTQVQMVWPERLLKSPPVVKLPAGYKMRTYRPGDETRFYKVMELAGWSGWNEEKLHPWLFRSLPEGWFMVIHQENSEIVATAMATHDHTWLRPFCGELGWLACTPDHTGKGLGMAVTAAATARFIAAGYLIIHLYTEPWRLAALKIYLKLGYIPYLDKSEPLNLWRKICKRLQWPYSPEEWKSQNIET